MQERYTDLAEALAPFLVDILNGSSSSSGTNSAAQPADISALEAELDAHMLNTAIHHTLAELDLRYYVIGAIDVHDRLHDVLNPLDHAVTGSSGQVLGLTATDTLGLLTPSSDGAANHSTILRSSSAGGLTLDSLTVPLVKSSNYQNLLAGIEGFSIGVNPDDASQHVLHIGKIVSDELLVHLFTADETFVRRASDLLTPSFGIVAADDPGNVTEYTVPAENSTVNVWFHDSAHLAGALFSEGEWVKLQHFARGTGILLANYWFAVSGYYTDGTHTNMQRWTLTNKSASAVGQKIKPGDALVSFGSSGDGYIERTVIDGGPRSKYVTWSGTDPKTGTHTVHTQIGDLSDAPTSIYPSIGGYGAYLGNAYIVGSLYAAAGDVAITDSGSNWQAANVADGSWDPANKITFTTDPMDPLDSNIVSQMYGLRVDEGGGNFYGRTRIESRVGAGSGLTSSAVDMYVVNGSGVTQDHAQVGVEIDGTDPIVWLWASIDNGDTAGTIKAKGTIDLWGDGAAGGKIIPHTNHTGSLGDASHYWQYLFVDSIFGATIISSETLTGQTWSYESTAMTVDAKDDGADSTLYILNSGAGSRVAHLWVEGGLTLGSNITMAPSATIDGVDLSTFYTTFGAHVTTFNNHVAATAAHGATGAIVGTTNTQTLTNKTLTLPIIAQVKPSAGNTLTFPDRTDTIVTRGATETLTNKTLTLPVIAQITNGGTLTLPVATDTLVGRATTDTLSNKTLAAPTVTGLMSAADATFSGAVGIGGEASAYKLRVVGTTNITGAATLGSTINIAGTVTAQGDVAVGDDLTVADTAIISGVFTAQSDVVLPYWEIDALTGVMQTTGDYAFSPPGATDDYEGIRLTPSLGSIESTYLSASRLATEVLVFELVTVNAGDLIIAKSGGRLREAVSFSGASYLVDNAGNRIVDHAGNYIVLNDGSLEFTIKLEEPPQPGQLLEPGDQIAISGRPTTEIWTRGTNIPYAINRFYPATTHTSALPVTVKAVVVSAVEGQSNEYVVRLVNNVYYKSITFPAGAGVANYGRNGDAYLSLTTRNKSAFMDIGTLPGTGWDDSLTPFIRLGDIGGLRNVANPGDVGLVGGDINNGVDDYFKIAQDGITLHNGEHVIADANGVRRVLMSTAGLSIKLYEDPVETLADQDDIFSNDEIYQSAITWVDDVDDPESIYGAAYAYKNQSWTGAHDHVVGLEAIRTDDTTSAIARLRAGQAFITATTTRSTSTMRISAQNFLAVDSPSITITGNTAIVIDGGVVRFISIPTSSSGLPTGAIWNDSGTLKIVS